MPCSGSIPDYGTILTKNVLHPTRGKARAAFLVARRIGRT
jgi:hypothetical protein